MFVEIKASLFSVAVDAIVVPTNCRGVQGAGLAKQAASIFPQWSKRYADICNHPAAKVQPGDALIWHVPASTYEKYCTRGIKFWDIIAVATKDDWRLPSKIEWIEQGLENIRLLAGGWNLHTIGIPLIGAGLGNLPPEQVRGLIRSAFQKEADVTAILCTIGGS
jgi:O-acetyl-ADP-ribose deacetylase (regulator of RNase III)